MGETQKSQHDKKTWKSPVVPSPILWQNTEHLDCPSQVFKLCPFNYENFIAHISLVFSCTVRVKISLKKTSSAEN